MLRCSPNIHERFIRHIWSKQYLRTDLYTTDKKPLKVLDVGVLNSDSGPDFLNAKIRLNGTIYTGDVEIHRNVFDWIQHQHQEDPHYNKVILHVVLEEVNDTQQTFVQSGRRIPVLVLDRFLSESIHSVWQKAILDERVRKSEKIHCFERNDLIAAGDIERWLSRLAVERIELKLRRFEERLKQLVYEDRMTIREKQHTYGEPPLEGNHNEIPPPFPDLMQKDFSRKDFWEQILYEGVMEGLGYSKNREPFLKLAKNLTLKKIKASKIAVAGVEMESVLFGISGLLPKIKTLKKDESREYVRKLVHKWKELKHSISCEGLHASDWQFFPTRPSNFPTIRLAAATGLTGKFLTGDIFRSIIQTLKSTSAVLQKVRDLFRVFGIETNEYWHYHYSFNKSSDKYITVLGAARLREIVINAILPVALLYARIFKDPVVRGAAIEVYNSLPAFEDNSITRLMENQLLKGRLPMNTVNRQQAVIQLYKYYCTENRCSECEFGRIMK